MTIGNLHPANILLIKSHSMGIGDLLRSSAAWSALKARWPEAKLHLLMMSKHSGYASEAFIRSHHLLASAHFVTVKVGHPGQGKQRSLPRAQVWAEVAQRPLALHLSDAGFEREVNQAFIALLQVALALHGWQAPVVDWVVKLNLDELAGLLGQADLVVSSDSGPYHMAVALGMPTLCWFNFDTPPSCHPQPGVVVLVLPEPAAFVRSAQKLLSEQKNT